MIKIPKGRKKKWIQKAIPKRRKGNYRRFLERKKIIRKGQKIPRKVSKDIVGLRGKKYKGASITKLRARQANLHLVLTGKKVSGRRKKRKK